MLAFPAILHSVTSDQTEPFSLSLYFFSLLCIQILYTFPPRDTISMHMQRRKMYTVDKNADYDHDDNGDRVPQRLPEAEAMDHYSSRDITITALPSLFSSNESQAASSVKLWKPLQYLENFKVPEEWIGVAWRNE